MITEETIRDSLLDRIYDINEKTFETVALDLWRYQYQFNGIYRAYVHLLGLTPERVRQFSEVPFLPISMFRDHEVQTGNWDPEVVFRSSGTTGAQTSKHLMRSLQWYHRNAEKGFTHFFGPPAKYTWLAMLPSYMERPDSSLISMVSYFMGNNGNQNPFFSKPDEALVKIMSRLKEEGKPAILIGVSFALLDLIENFDIPVWEDLIIVDTGGMKGRRKEITREELKETFRSSYPDLRLCSEYGMTELSSQAYLLEKHFMPAPTMHVSTREVSDPLSHAGTGRRGAINIIDLANIDSCAFIATDDLGIVYEDGSFDVLGRLDQSDIRGCNLLYAD